MSNSRLVIILLFFLAMLGLFSFVGYKSEKKKPEIIIPSLPFDLETIEVPYGERECRGAVPDDNKARIGWENVGGRWKLKWFTCVGDPGDASTTYYPTQET